MGLDTVEVVLWAETRFGVELPDEDVSRIRCVGEFSRYVHTRLVHEQGAPMPTEQWVYEQVFTHLVTTFGLQPEEVTRDAEFVRDLGLS